MHLLARSRLVVLSSRAEGGANVISEALAYGVPVLASRIPGTLGLLGPDYPGYFDVGDTRALTALLDRAESEPEFLEALQTAMARRAWLIDPVLERRAWRALLDELVSGRARRPPLRGAALAPGEPRSEEAEGEQDEQEGEDVGPPGQDA